MNLKTFIQQNRSDWMLLEKTLKEINKRKVIHTPKLIDDFQLLYQKVALHLSFAQTYFPKDDVTSYLNELVSRAHNTFYRDQLTSMHQLKHFFGITFVRLISSQWKFILIALILFFTGAIGSFISVMNDPLHLYSVLPEEIAYSVDPEQLGNYEQPIDSPTISASILTNNIQVAILAFAGGITLGTFTIYLLINNGIIIGALAALFWQHGKFYDFWAFIVPHGMIELTAIFIAGGSGLMMGYYILVPGAYPRTYQLKRQAKRSVQLLLGTIPLFIIAGIIEGYITPSAISLEAKYLFALFTIIGLIIYIWVGNRFAVKKHTPTIARD